MTCATGTGTSLSLLKRLCREDAGQDLIEYVAPDRHHRDRGNPGVSDDSIQDGRRLSGLERRRAGDLGYPPADVGRLEVEQVAEAARKV